MTDFKDPEPRTSDLDPRLDPNLNPADYDDRYVAESRPPWGWIAGAVFVFLVLAAVFSTAGNNVRTRTETSLPSTTGMAPADDQRPAAPPTAVPAPITPPTAAAPTAPASPTGGGIAQ